MVLLAFGVGFIGGGLYYRIYNDVITRYIEPYIVDSEGVYYLGSQLIWDMFPYLLILVGIAFLIMAGFAARNRGMVVQQ